MALGTSMTTSIRQTTAQRMRPRTIIMMTLLAKPIGDLREAVKKEIESNPAIDDVEFLSFYRRGVSASSGDVNAALENTAARGESLGEHLMSALRMTDVDERTRMLGELVIGDLNEKGHFEGSVPDLMMVAGATEEEVERARRLVMTLDPIGCGARNVEECLTAQLALVPAADRDECRKFIARFDDLLNKRCEVSEVGAKALEAFRKYRDRFNTEPGRKFEYRRVETVTADIVVDKDGEVDVVTADIPEIRVSAKYLQMSKDRSLDEETRKYAQERVRHALDFAAALERRKEVMVKIAELTIEAQRGFLAKGEKGLKPLTMTEIAKSAKCSVATVSRAAHSKFVKTPRGMLPLKRFFSLADGAMTAKLRELVAANPKASDRKLAEEMAAAGFSLARRTVNKYRRRIQS